MSCCILSTSISHSWSLLPFRISFSHRSSIGNYSFLSHIAGHQDQTFHLTQSVSSCIISTSFSPNWSPASFPPSSHTTGHLHHFHLLLTRAPSDDVPPLRIDPQTIPYSRGLRARQEQLRSLRQACMQHLALEHIGTSPGTFFVLCMNPLLTHYSGDAFVTFISRTHAASTLLHVSWLMCKIYDF